MSQADFGIIGLGTMGRNLALNFESNGYSVAVWNLETEWIDEFLHAHQGLRFTGAKTLPELVQALEPLDLARALQRGPLSQGQRAPRRVGRALHAAD